MLNFIIYRAIPLACAACLLAAMPALVNAQDHTDSHGEVERSGALSYQQILTSALSVAPELLAGDSRSAQVDAYTKLGNSLFASNPSLQMSYIDDRVLDDIGMREMEAGIAMSLWRPGQKQAARLQAEQYDKLYQSWLTYVEWLVAGRLRVALHDLQQANRLLENQHRLLTNAEEFAQIVTTLFNAGAVPEIDVLTARSLVLEQRNAVYDAEAELVDAERNYQVVTGLNLRPQADFAESIDAGLAISPEHPWLEYVSANVDVARSNIAQAKRLNGANPVLGFGFRRERANRFDTGVDSLGLSLEIPLGKPPALVAGVSEARRAEADLQVALQQARLVLTQRLHEGEHQLAVLEQKLVDARTQLELNQQRWEMARVAYELGETTLYPARMAFQEMQLAEDQLSVLELQRQALYSQINQSLGKHL